MKVSRYMTALGPFRIWPAGKVVCRSGIFVASVAAAVFLIGYFSLVYAQAAASSASEQPVTAAVGQRQKTPIGKVKTVSFVLNDGRYVQGKVVAEDRSAITASEFAGSTIVVSAYNRDEIVAGSIRYKNVLESKYWEGAAEYFLGRTWDFEDDPDDFIQAVRCYEQAKSLVIGAYGAEHERTKQLQRKIEQVKADKKQWAAQVESRAGLRELELKVAFDQKVSRLEKLLRQNAEQLRQINALLEDTQLAANITEMQRNVQTLSRQARSDIESNRRRIDELYFLYRRGERITRGGPIIKRRSW